MGRPQAPDENLPEVAENRPYLAPNPHGDHLPEVVPDSSPEAAQQRYYMETDKYPAQYDTAPKLLHEEPLTPEMSPMQQYRQPWGPASIVGGDYHSVSALSPNSAVPWHSFHSDDQQTYVGSEPEAEKRICGLRKRLFIIIAVVLAVVIIAAAVGGGVGGAMASRQSDSDAAPAETDSATESGSSPTSASSTDPTAASTTSSAPTPSITFLNNQTNPSVFEMFAFQGFSGNNFTGNATDIYLEPGYYDFNISITSYVWVTKKTDCCVTFCKDKKTTGGFRCDPIRRNRTEDNESFPRVSLWCGNRLNEVKQVQCS